MLKLPRVFALTYQQSFFEHLGFRLVDKATMPHKVWGECMDCPKFPNCDELAMIKDAPFLETDR
jgi:amino-acid N-acetyltransferase